MKTKYLGLGLFFTTIIAITIPLILLASGAATDNFSASVTLGNSPPVISWVISTASDSPAEGNIKNISLQFNVTDNNTVIDINTSSTFMNISRAGETNRTSSSCVSILNSSDSKTEEFNCTITIYWYDVNGTWDICAYARDNSSSAASNCTSSDFTMNQLDSVDLVNGSIAFSGSAGQADVGPQHVVVNNTGNLNYVNLQLNATYLNSGGNTLGVGNFSVNVTDSANGQALTENTFLTIASSTLNRGAAATKDMYFYLDIPTGLPVGT
jgi:hypothetical protein